MLDKITVVDQIEIAENGSIRVRRAMYVTEDGVRITEPQYLRVAYAPGADVSKEDVRVKAHAATAWTTDVLDAAATAFQAAPRAALDELKG